MYPCRKWIHPFSSPILSLKKLQKGEKKENMVTLGQQIKTQERVTTPTRNTRTQRLLAKRESERKAQLEKRAQQIKSEQFQDKTTTTQETYYEYRPAQYSERTWRKFTPERREALLKNYREGRGYEYYATKGDLVRIEKTRTVTKTIPFTLDSGENSYTQIYQDLDPSLKPYFTDPQILQGERQQRIQNVRTMTQSRAEDLRIKIAVLDEEYQQRKQRLIQQWNDRPASYRSDSKNYKRYNDNLRKLDLQYETERAQLTGRLKGYSGALTQLDTGKEINFNDIVIYANQLGDIAQGKRDIKLTQLQSRRREEETLRLRQEEEAKKGNTFTGIQSQSFVDPKTKQETFKGVRYYLGGVEVSRERFSKEYDVYESPATQETAFVNKGVTITELPAKQQQALFPKAYQKAVDEAQTQEELQRQEQVQKALAFEGEVESLPVQEQAPPKDTRNFLKKTTDFVGDIFSGIFLKSSQGLGVRGFISGEPTTLSDEELKQRRQDILQSSRFLGVPIKELPVSDKTKEYLASTVFPIPGTTGFEEAQIKSFFFSQELRRGGRENLAQREKDVETIEKGVGKLNEYNVQIEQINQDVQAGTISNEQAQERYSNIQKEQKQVFSDLASQGIKTNIETDEEGKQTISFTSKAFETDVAPASVKLLRSSTPSQRGALLTTGIGLEALESYTIGLLSGGTGVSARIGVLVNKSQIVKGVVVGGVAGLTIGSLFKSGQAGYVRGEEAGIGKLGGTLLGVGIPTTKLVSFGVGSYVGTKLYTSKVISQLQNEGVEETKTVRVRVGNKEYDVPASTRTGKTIQTEGQPNYAKAEQFTAKSRNIPGTDIKIDTTGKLEGRFLGEEGRSVATSVTKITGKDATRYLQQKTLFSKILFFDDKTKPGQTAIVTFTKVKGGVQIERYLSDVKIENIQTLAQTTDGGKTIFLDFNRVITRVEEPIFVRGATLSDASISSSFNRFIGIDKVFQTFGGESKLVSFSGNKQIIDFGARTPIIEIVKTPNVNLEVTTQKSIQAFTSFGSEGGAQSRTLQQILQQILQGQLTQKGSSSPFFLSERLLNDKRAQVLVTPPSTPSTLASVQPPQIALTPQLVQPFTPVTPLISQLTPAIQTAIAQNSLVGTTFLAGLSSSQYSPTLQAPLSQTRLSTLTLSRLQERQAEIQDENIIEEQANTTRQTPLQRTPLQNILVQELITPAPITAPVPTSIPPPINFVYGGLPNDSQYFKQVRKKAQKKKSAKELFYVQDFTSKIVGFKPIEVTPKQAQALAQQTQTGFELRPPIIIKEPKLSNTNNKDARKLKRLLSQ